MLRNTTLIRFIVDLGRLICTWLQVNIRKEANLVLDEVPALLLHNNNNNKSSNFYHPDFPGDLERFYPGAKSVSFGLIAPFSDGKGFILIGQFV